jgi:hypothetical protein
MQAGNRILITSYKGEKVRLQVWDRLPHAEKEAMGVTLVKTTRPCARTPSTSAQRAGHQRGASAILPKAWRVLVAQSAASLGGMGQQFHHGGHPTRGATLARPR